MKALHRLRVMLRRIAFRRGERPWAGLTGRDRLVPMSRVFGLDRGEAIDRYYIARFLERHGQAVQGHVLEVGDSQYTRRFGGTRVTRSEVLHVTAGIPGTTLVGNLETGEGIPRGVFDCMILTQTFSCIYEAGRAVHACHLALKPGGVLLATLPGISQISRFDTERWGDFWRFTEASCRRLFGEVFGEENVETKTYGNVLSACAFLYGLAAEELDPRELAETDSDYPVLIGIKALKAGGP